MASYGNEPEAAGRRRDGVFAAVVVVLALSSAYVGPSTQQTVSNVLQSTLLRPFIAMQVTVSEARRRAGEVDALTERVDSLTALVVTQGSLADENRTLRRLLELSERAGPRFVPATVLRPGTPGSQSMFIVDVGSRDGVPVRAAVVGPEGLVGVIQEVRAESSVALDWSHPDFRASAMLADGTTFGIIERRRGRFQEDDRLILSGTAYATNILPGMVVVTSGLGVLPRGIPIGKIDRLLDTEGSWRKSFWIEPMLEPGGATHVLVLTEGSDDDISGLWPDGPLETREESVARERGPGDAMPTFPRDSSRTERDPGGRDGPS